MFYIETNLCCLDYYVIDIIITFKFIIEYHGVFIMCVKIYYSHVNVRGSYTVCVLIRLCS